MYINTIKENINLFYLHFDYFCPRILSVWNVEPSIKQATIRPSLVFPHYHKIALNKFQFIHSSAQGENLSEIKSHNLRTYHTLICTFLSPLFKHKHEDFSYKGKKEPMWESSSRIPSKIKFPVIKRSEA